MGSSVRTANKTPPKMSRVTECSECGHRRQVLNGAWLRWLRERAGIDQRTFAKRLGISGPYISDIERNRRECPDVMAIEYRKLRRKIK